MFPRIPHIWFVWYMVSCITCSQKYSCTQRGKKEKGVLSTLKGRDLETAAVKGRKTMKRFSSCSEEALPGSRSMTLCGNWEGKEREGVMHLSICDRKGTVGL